MAINMNVRNDVSYLFSGMNKNNGLNNGGNWLGDYASIKNGSYGKLMKAYYKADLGKDVKSIARGQMDKTVSGEEKKALTKVQSTTDALKDSADALLVTGEKSVFAKDDKDSAYNAVDKFVKNYNAVIDAASDSGTASVVSRANSMANNTAINTKGLAKIGITVNADKTLSLDKDTFMNADTDRVKSLFQGNGSFGFQTSSQASMMNFAADSAASKANTYSAGGTRNYFNDGNLFNGYF